MTYKPKGLVKKVRLRDQLAIICTRTQRTISIQDINPSQRSVGIKIEEESETITLFCSRGLYKELFYPDVRLRIGLIFIFNANKIALEFNANNYITVIKIRDH